MPKVGDHAVVVGASMAGLLAARVLADAYRRVTIVERDPLPESGSARKGVPQGRHAHGLLPRVLTGNLRRRHTRPASPGADSKPGTVSVRFPAGSYDRLGETSDRRGAVR